MRYTLSFISILWLLMGWGMAVLAAEPKPSLPSNLIEDQMMDPPLILVSYNELPRVGDILGLMSELSKQHRLGEEDTLTDLSLPLGEVSQDRDVLNRSTRE